MKLWLSIGFIALILLGCYGGYQTGDRKPMVDSTIPILRPPSPVIVAPSNQVSTYIYDNNFKWQGTVIHYGNSPVSTYIPAGGGYISTCINYGQFANCF